MLRVTAVSTGAVQPVCTTFAPSREMIVNVCATFYSIETRQRVTLGIVRLDVGQVRSYPFGLVLFVVVQV